MIGESLGSYRVVRELGAGGMGVVYVGEHLSLGHPVAIKLLKPELSANPAIVGRFFDEARASSLVRHPAIVEVFDFGTAPDGAAYFVMELLEGQSLAERMAGPPLGPAAAGRIGRQIAEALAICHDAGIIHRDLKPENVFLARDPASRDGERVKILDFGIAKLADELRASDLRTRRGTLMGSPLYMSPEQCRGAEAVDDRADVYSLGCILYHALAGRPPFVFDSLAEILGAHQHAAPPDLRRLAAASPPPLLDLVDRCLAKAPGSRPSMREIAAALERPSTPARAATPAPPRPRWLIPALAAGGLAAGGLAVVLAVASSSREDRAAPADAAPIPVAATTPVDAAAPRPVAVDAAPPVDAAPRHLGVIRVRTGSSTTSLLVDSRLRRQLEAAGMKTVESGDADGELSARCSERMTNKVYRRPGDAFGGIRGSRVRCAIHARAGSWRTRFQIAGSTPDYVFDGDIFGSAVDGALADPKLEALPHQLALVLGNAEAERALLAMAVRLPKSRFIFSFLRNRGLDLDAPARRAYVLVAAGKLEAAAALGAPALEALETRLRLRGGDKKQAIAAVVSIGGDRVAALLVDLLGRYRPVRDLKYAADKDTASIEALLAGLGQVGGREHLPFLSGYADDARPEIASAAGAARAAIEERLK